MQRTPEQTEKVVRDFLIRAKTQYGGKDPGAKVVLFDFAVYLDELAARANWPDGA
jgi:hypothetical protein